MQFENPEIITLVRRAAEWNDGAFLKPLTQSLGPPRTSLVSKLTEPAGGIKTALLSPDGKQVLYIKRDDTTDSTEIKVWSVGHAGESITLCTVDASHIAVSHDGAKLAVASESGEVSVWPLNMRSGKPSCSFNTYLKPAVLSFADHSARLILVSPSREVKFWNVKRNPPELEKELVLELPYQNEPFLQTNVVAIATEINVLFIGTGFVSVDNLHLWDLNEGQLISSFINKVFSPPRGHPEWWQNAAEWESAVLK